MRIRFPHKIITLNSFFLCLLISVILSSCGNKIIYYGRSYEPTSNVEIFFKESDVTEPNETMGKLTYEVTARRSSDKVQKKLLRRAQRKGADILVFDDIELTRTGSKTAGGGGGMGGRRIFFGLFGTTTKYEKGQLVKATLLKYKKNIR